jgi:hypothetical protein
MEGRKKDWHAMHIKLLKVPISDGESKLEQLEHPM